MSGCIVVVGSVNADLSVQVGRHPSPGETLPGTSALMRPGGKGANQAVAAALLGADAVLVGAVGDDANAGVALERIRASGLDYTHVQRVPGATGLAIVVVDGHGENAIIVVAGANQHVDHTFVDRSADLIRGADVVIAQGEIPAAGTARAAALTTGRFILNLAPVIELPLEVVRSADPLVVNEHEGELALAMLRPEQPDATGLTHAEVVQALVEEGIASVVMTLGADGALVLDRDGALTPVPAAPITRVDSTGAGDAFVGALAARLAAGDTLVDAARYASRVGAFACTRAGAQDSYPGEADTLPELAD